MATFDASIRPSYLLSWFYGIWTMLFCHNLGVSVFLFTKRQRNLLNIFKILLNFSGILKGVFGITLTLVPDNITSRGCEILGYMMNLSAASFRISLSIFLLWRLRQIERKNPDLFVGSFLLLITTGFQFARVFIGPLRPTYAPQLNGYTCAGDTPETAQILQWIGLGFDMAIDLFVTYRMVQILRKANQDSKRANVTNPFNRTIFTSVMYWNFLGLGISIVYHIVSAIQVSNFGINTKQSYAIPGVGTLVYIALSYLITIDAEIVRAIQGRPHYLQTTSNTDPQ